MATDASGLEITKVFVDSSVRSPNTGDDTGKFTWQCPGDTLRTGNPCYVTVSDLSLAHSFYNVPTHSEKLYRLYQDALTRNIMSLWCARARE